MQLTDVEERTLKQCSEGTHLTDSDDLDMIEKEGGGGKIQCLELWRDWR